MLLPGNQVSSHGMYTWQVYELEGFFIQHYSGRLSGDLRAFAQALMLLLLFFICHDHVCTIALALFDLIVCTLQINLLPLISLGLPVLATSCCKVQLLYSQTQLSQSESTSEKV